jgi:biotin carboxylase
LKHRLAVAYDAGSFSPIEIVTAVGEGCDLIWVIDSSRPLGPMSQILSRTGSVVDIAGRSQDKAVAQVAASRPEGIVAFNDSQLSTASMIAAGLGLRFNAPPVTHLFLDKCDQRAALRAAGVVVPGFVSIPADASAGQMIALAANITFPAVLKPRRGTGSRDTYRVESPDALVSLLAPAHRDRPAARTEYILEEFIPDAGFLSALGFSEHVSVESVVVARRTRHLAVTGRFPLAEPFRETGNVIPSVLSPEETETVTALADEATMALDVEYGSLHTEIKMTPTGPRVIESNARVGGGGIEDLFVMSYGESLLRLAAMAALGIEPPANIRLRPGAIAYHLFFQPPCWAHRLVRMAGLAELTALPGVAELTVNRREGDEVNWRLGSSEYVVSIRGSVSDADALRGLRARIAEHLDLTYSAAPT